MKFNIETLNIYLKFHGDEDGFSRVASPLEKSKMSGFNWSKVSEAIQLLHLIEKNLVSEDYSNSILVQIRDQCLDEQTFDFLIKMRL